MLQNLFLGLSQFSLTSYAMVLLGSVAGLIFGCIPGLNASVAITLAIPISFHMDPISAFALFMGIFVGGCSGGLISAILIGVPGTPSNSATIFDGYTMARNGRPGRALGLGIFFSFLGTVLGLVFLFTISEPLARIAIKLGPLELFAIMFFSLSLVSVLAGKDLAKGWFVALFGFALGMVGISAADGTPRMTLGISKLTSGFSSTPAMVGIFVVGSLFSASLADKANTEKKTIMDFNVKGLGFGLSDFFKQIGNFIRSGLIGVSIGVLPGIGGITSALMSYTVTKSLSKHPEEFGKGCDAGIVAPETANNASIGGAMIPLLALGIPGDGTTALLLGALMLHDFMPGPMLFKTNPKFCYAVFAALLLAAILVVIIEYIGLPALVKTLKIPKNVMLPVIMVMIMVGCISVNNRVFECYVMIFFGVCVYLLKKFNFPTAPMVLGFILGPSAEVYLRRGLSMNGYKWSALVTQPVSCVFLALSLILTLLLLRQNSKEQEKMKKLAKSSNVELTEDDD